MSLLHFLRSLFVHECTSGDTLDFEINPASGLPMLDSVIDVAGNPFGTNNQHDQPDDHFSHSTDTGFSANIGGTGCSLGDWP